MIVNKAKIFFEILIDKSVVRRALTVALVVGVVLNLINQWEAMLFIEGAKINIAKFLLTFMVPYMVSSYSSVMAKLSFKVGEVSPINANLICPVCDNKVISVNKGDIIPECPKCSKRTKWLFLSKGEGVVKNIANEKEAMALFAEYNPAPVFRFSKTGEVLMSNPAANQFFGEDIVGLDVRLLVKAMFETDFARAIDRGEIKSVVEKIGDISYRFEMRGVPKLGVCQVYGADITEILEAKLDNIRLASAIAQTSNSVMMTDINGDIVFVNKAFEQITGYSRNEVNGKNPRFLKTDELSDEVYSEMWKAISSGSVWRGEFHNRKKDGTTYWEEATISPVVDEEGNTINYLSVKEDVTEKKAAKLEMRSMAMFAELNPEPVFRFSCEGVVLKANASANNAFGKASIEGEYITHLLESAKELDIKTLIDNAEIVTIEEEISDKIFRFILRGLPEFNVCQIYGSDVTLRRKAEQEVKDQKESIEQSINYASRIQGAVLPSSVRIEELMPEHFILFKPRDVVSGDFYWLSRIDNKVIIAAVDCTGHGVPGAFMSMLGVSFLNDIILKNRELNTGEVLNNLREKVKVTLAQSGSNESKDGMDLALIVLDYDTMIMQFSGAYNPLCIVRNGEMEVYKGDKMPIGSHLSDKEPFKSHDVKVEKGDVFYIFSDGFPDQFGGEKGMKYMAKRFRQKLVDIYDQPMEKQKELLDADFMEWKGSRNQIDDVLVIGGKV